MAVYK